MDTVPFSQSAHVYSKLLLERFVLARHKTEQLVGPLIAEDFMLSVTEDTSPPKWHLAHTSWFFEHFLLEKYKEDYHCFNPAFNFLFNSYYKQAGAYLPKSKRAFISRPSVEEVLDFRRHVTEQMSRLIQDLPSIEILKVLEIGINHEEQHQELLLMDIKRNFFENPLRPHYHHEVLYSGHASDGVFHRFQAGLVQVGIPKESSGFAFDNEKDQHQVWLERFAINSHLVTNREYLEFIESGGYGNSSLWLSDGWDFKEKEAWQNPLYWEFKNDSWWVLTLAGLIPLDLSAPVSHVSYYEAHAYAKWKGARLPTEAEWETAARLEPIVGSFLENSSLEAEASPETHQFFSQIHGTVWEWTSSAYEGYPRYEPLREGLSEYNEKFMCQQLVLRGGCALTPKSHYRLTYRNFYYPNQRWMYGGIRLAKDVE